jgi:hypothetical protein
MMYTVQTKLYRKGDYICGHAKVITARGVRNIFVKASISQTMRQLKAMGMQAKVSGNVGWFGSDLVKGVGSGLESVAKAAKSITKAKVVQKMGGIVKDVVKSDITKVAVGVVAVAIPAVGVPAAAALVTANQVLDAAEKADRYVGHAQNLGSNMKQNPNAAIKAGLAYAATGDAKQALALTNTPKGRQTLAQYAGQVRAGLQAKQVIAQTVKGVQAKDPGAMKFAKSLVIAKRARRKLKALKSTVAAHRQSAGILVLPSGELLKGAFHTAGLSRI